MLRMANAILGVFIAGMMIPIFWHLVNGGSWSEPNVVVARAELTLACIFTLFYFVQIPYWIKKALRRR